MSGVGWRARLIVLGTFAAVFAAGVAAGVAWQRSRSEQPMFKVMVQDGRVEAFDRLGLSAEQKRRIERVFLDAQPRTDAVLREALPRLRAVTDSVNADIHAILTPEQSKRLGRLQARRMIDVSGHDSASH
jgi:Spy/CpxP family protein refolding chaperone